MSEVELLAIGAHPDDVEIFCGGTVAKMVARGHRVAILDLSRGELASNGTPELRAEEARAAAEVLGVLSRDNLGLPDGGIDARDPGQVAALVGALRAWRPRLVLAPVDVERHPDHAEAGRLVERAVFFAGVAGYATETTRHRVDEVLFYPMRVGVAPTFYVDVSGVIAVKRRAIACHASQVGGGPGRVPTMVADPRSMAALEARERVYGARIGAEYAEAFVAQGAIGIDDPVTFFTGRERPTLFAERRR